MLKPFLGRPTRGSRDMIADDPELVGGQFISDGTNSRWPAGSQNGDYHVTLVIEIDIISVSQSDVPTAYAADESTSIGDEREAARPKHLDKRRLAHG